MIYVRTTLIFLVLLGVIGFESTARADEDSEREALSRIAYELDQLQQMVADAGKEANSATRVRFRYDWLTKDLELIRRGVDDHLDRPRQPRPIPPLRGDYRQ